MDLDLLTSVLAAVLSMVAGGVASTEFIQKILRTVLKRPEPRKSYSEQLNELTEALSAASKKVDAILAEMAQVASQREKTVQGLEASLLELESKEKDARQRIEQLKKVPLPAAEYFAELIEAGEKRSAWRDYWLFGAGVVVSTVIAICLKLLGIG
ncbi:hypothetical protein EKH79_04785 [Dyella dinghuensis]|uniref:Uncharacterized protein n=1 Tax=Dyella dinghuensis TaxID=1920169 RepID=A0A432LWY3_9GAMM|nr:hypothetical protein [Dyella dinghuensis]RUL66015.1 hypothetical protein EKH79_04785 [Dyella dinghuensis]